MIISRQITNMERAGIPPITVAREFRVVLLFSVLHVPFGVLMYNAGILALLHPAAVFCLGLYWATKRTVPLERVALIIAYLIGAEVLWRMAQVPVFWEFGKLGSAALVIVALIRRQKYRIPALPLIYFLLLLPGCILTFTVFDLVSARSNISATLSGPFFLFLACWFFAHVSVAPSSLRRLFLAAIVPLISVAFATLFYTVTNEDIQFTTESNFATSGGFGPNQVSSMLGLAAFLALASLIIFRNDSKHKVYYFLAATLFSAQSVMTFSRGGMYNAVVGLLGIVVLELRNPVKAAKRLAPIVALTLLFFVVVFPFLNDFTGGKLLARFEETGTANRAEIIDSDIEIFLENPVFGVGVGVSADYRAKFLGSGASTHTEFFRLISEHGILGVFALFALVGMAIVNTRRHASRIGRALCIGCCLWCALYMFNAGMRLAAPSFIWGLMFITIIGPVRNPGESRPGFLRSRSFSSSA